MKLAICSCCGKQLPINEIELCFRRPDDFLLIPLDEREARTQANDDLCAIWGEGDADHRCFVRGLLSLNVKDWGSTYSLGAWLEVSQTDFKRIYDLWDEADQSSEPPFSAKLANAVPFHSSTRNLSGELLLTGPTTRPSFRLSESSNSLFEEQSRGISAHRANQYAALAAK
ncbi:DUF2199 domain-containing protein [Pseudoduganella violaceinigra]|uniref:DUF2199 domain-containing protein n=1 Tax=Pseudoduganella violaceinigra TaxID=246602 RepID=UPI000558E6E9|nr:DUF2199 domain-containing protein [Pseudoduganella violaceinigra]